MMGSALEVESEYGKGSVFSFRLGQKVIDKSPIGEYVVGMTTDMQGGGEGRLMTENADVLVVDDNDMNLKVAAGLMKRCGIVPDVAESGDGCIERISAKHYDIVFLDDMMPGKNGVQTLHIIKDRGLLPADTVVIALTANAVAGAKEKYISEGFADYLSKPIEVNKLEKMLEKYLPPQKTVSGGTAADRADTPAGLPNSPVEQLKAAGINTKAGLGYAMNSEEFYAEMLAAFAEGAKEKSREILHDLETANWKDYRTRVHALKSTAKMIGADKLAERALWHENAAKEERVSDIIADNPQLMEIYNKTVKDIEAALKK